MQTSHDTGYDHEQYRIVCANVAALPAQRQKSTRDRAGVLKAVTGSIRNPTYRAAHRCRGTPIRARQNGAFHDFAGTKWKRTYCWAPGSASVY
jgi:hypothetical protein